MKTLTPYGHVNAVIHLLLSGVEATLGPHFIGLYLSGSLAAGDFDSERSDIDFVVVTAGDLPADVLPALEALHARIRASGLKSADRLEGAYIPQKAIRRYDPAEPPYPYVNDGVFGMGPLGGDWVIQRHILREQGVVVTGPPLSVMIDPLSPGDLRRAVLAVLRDWWAPMLRDPVRLRDPGYQPYAVLTMCRAMYTLQHGTIVSKPAAAQWAQAALGEPSAALIERALAWRPGAEWHEMNETREFIQYTLERSRGI